MSADLSELNPPTVALDCEPGVIRLFGLSDIASHGLTSGWAYPEYGHTWNENVDPTLLLSVEGDIGDALLVIEGEPYVTPAQPLQEMTVYVNGYRAGFWRLVERLEHTLRIGVEPEWWFRRTGRSVLKVVFHLPTSVRPVDIGDGVDSRHLGFCFRSLLLEHR